MGFHDGDGVGGDKDHNDRAGVIIVGAGLAGLALALELSRRGHRATLLERAVPGAEASSAAAGILGPQLEHQTDAPTLDLALAGAQATAALVEELERRTRVGMDRVTTPALKVAFTPEEAQALEERVAWQRARGLAAELLDGEAAQRLEPRLGLDVTRAALFADDHALDPRRYAEALQAAVRAEPAIGVRAGVAVTGLTVEDNRCVGVTLEDGAALLGRATVICGGAWSLRVPGVAAALGLSADDVRPVRGQIVELAGPPGLLGRVVYGPEGYMVPRADGRLVCGSTMEEVGFDKAVTPEAVTSIRARAARVVPALADLEVRSTWAGLRPAPRDGLPLLGPTHLDGLWLSTGHFRNGVLLAAISARVLGALLQGEAVPLDVTAFSPRRWSRVRAGAHWDATPGSG